LITNGLKDKFSNYSGYSRFLFAGYRWELQKFSSGEFSVFD
jgi:hypothetical protein